ncbi:hypothetical protein [Novosphingobium sp. M1R2S20]|uniref:Uncharacterized protein n=1 Tax=Novosphingobium rhizovicinum TaxID=3228928 RepID=A0ABV3R677_9SPHN
MFTACRYIPDAKVRIYYTQFNELGDVEFRFLAAMVVAVASDEGLMSP